MKTKLEWYKHLMVLYNDAMNGKVSSSDLIMEYKPFVDEIMPLVVPKTDPDYEDKLHDAYLIVAQSAINKDPLSLKDGNNTFFPWMWQNKFERIFAKENEIYEEYSPDFYEQMGKVEDKVLVEYFMDGLTDTQKQVINLLYGIDDGIALSLTDTGKYLGMSKQGAASHRDLAFLKMRKKI